MKQEWKRGAIDLLPMLAACIFGIAVGHYATTSKTIKHEWVVSSCERIR